ncbi:threonine aldolase family protein [Mucilaginibacter phyllosphaerae]
MSYLKRRNFLKLSGLTVLPSILPGITTQAFAVNHKLPPISATQVVSFNDDGPFYQPAEYINKLQEINSAEPIKMDFYGGGGAVAQLCEKFADLTGKPASIYMPSGTMANQLAISVLSGENTKIFVQETSHMYRDEGDSAQAVFSKRLIPVAQGEAHFTLEQLQEAINYHNQGEVFKSGIGTIAIENPVRRCDGKFVPLDEIKKISAWCREKGYKLHLDGARIFLAMAFNGVSLKEYASYFDTVYVSLYKYLGAAGGAILCGDKETIGHMEHLIKIHGGTSFSSWSNAAMALHSLNGLEDRLKKSAEKSADLFSALNKLPGVKITAIPNGSNIFNMELTGVDNKVFNKTLAEKYQIMIRAQNGVSQIRVNETLLMQDNKHILNAFADALKVAKV